MTAMLSRLELAWRSYAATDRGVFLRPQHALLTLPKVYPDWRGTPRELLIPFVEGREGEAILTHGPAGSAAYHQLHYHQNVEMFETLLAVHYLLPQEGLDPLPSERRETLERALRSYVMDPQPIRLLRSILVPTYVFEIDFDRLFAVQRLSAYTRHAVIEDCLWTLRDCGAQEQPIVMQGLKEKHKCY